MMQIMFSILIHEKLEVVLDQIINYRFFNPESGIVLHFSAGFDYENSSITRDEFEETVKNVGNVFINPESIRTGLFDIIQAHLLNFEYIEKICTFDYFALGASNELFIKHGVYQSMRNFDCGIGYMKVYKNMEWTQGRKAQEDRALQKILQDVGGNEIIGSQVEGTFFKKSLFHEICKIINKNYDYKSMDVPYAREEMYFSTIIWNLKKGGKEIRIHENGMFTYIPWERDLKIESDDIKRLWKETSSLFSVKRVSRELNDYIRIYIREKAGYYALESEIYKSLSAYEKVGRKENDREPLPFYQFHGKGVLELLRETMEQYERAKKNGSEIQFKNIVLQLEDEYGEAIFKEVSCGDLNVLALLIQISEIVRKNNNMPQYVIRPICWMQLYIYGNMLLKEINQQKEIALYGAGLYGKLFLEYLRKNGLAGKVAYFIVSDLRECKTIKEIPVISLGDFIRKSKGSTKVLITVRKKLQTELEECLCNANYKNYEIIQQEFLKVIEEEPHWFFPEKKV